MKYYKSTSIVNDTVVNRQETQLRCWLSQQLVFSVVILMLP